MTGWRVGWVRYLAGVGCALGLAGTAFAGTKPAVGKPGGPEERLVLEDLGFPGISPTFLATGGSMLTVHFVDSAHLLVTFSKRGLVPRVPDDPPGDEDRIVAGELVELATGKVLARTEWHLHDHGRYLWELGGGRFLLRIGETLSTFAPMVNLADGKPFLRTVFVHRHGPIAAVLVPVDGRLLTVETRIGERSDAGPVTANFYRLSGVGTPESPVLGEDVGAIHAVTAVSLPLDADGFLQSRETEKNSWSFYYRTFSGIQVSFPPVDSSCPPTLIRVGRGQVLATTCRGITGRVKLAAFDFEKHYLWEEPQDMSPLPPVFSLAPEAGRFAMSRITSIDTQDQFLTVGDPEASQEVRVYQTQTGDLLLKVKCDPLYRTSENFDLSGDGMKLAVVRGDAIEVYGLPKLTSEDRKDLAMLEKATPPVETGKIILKGLVDDAAADETQMPLVTPNGDGQTGRKAPTLLNPGEKPEFQKKE